MNLDIEEVRNFLQRDIKFNYLSDLSNLDSDDYLKLECRECYSVFYQNIFYHLHGGGCLQCSLQNISQVLNPVF